MPTTSQKPFSSNFLKVKKYLQGLQKEIRQGIEEIDGDFREIRWKYREHGGGKSLLIENPQAGSSPTTKKKSAKLPSVWEKGGVNISAVGGQLPETTADLLKVKRGHFSACGLSLVIHPYSPMIPTVHMNVRYFEMGNKDFWFGGGVDLTPYYPSPDDFRHFHETVHRSIVEVYPKRYREFKEKCDHYFTLPHRREMRGIGGVFFDYMKNNFEKDFTLIRSLGNSFLESYIPIVKNNLNRKYGGREKDFQLYRRGRYVEFNLLYDRGTWFGLKTGGRVDSILMSLPLNARFQSTKKFSRGSFEKEMERYYQPYNWVRRSL